MNRQQRRRMAAGHQKQAALHSASMASPGSADRVAELIPLALGHHQSGRLSQAELYYRKILAIEPTQIDALQLLGIVAHQTGRYELAVELIGKALQMNDQVPGWHNNMALALRRLGRMDEAVAHFRRAVNLKPGYSDALCNLGTALRERGELEEAAACYRAVLAVRPDHAEAQNRLAELLIDQNKLEEAISYCQHALVASPDNAEVHNTLGNALREKGRLLEAVTHYHRALAMRPNFADAHNSLGIASQRQGKLDEAVTNYRRALAISPAYAAAYNNLGTVLHWQDQSDEAVACYHRALAINANDAEVHNNLGNLLRDLGRANEARAACQKAIDLAPRNPAFHFTLATLKRFAADDRQIEAMEKIAAEEASLSAQDRIYLHFALAKAYDDIGDWERSFGHLLQGNALKRQVSSYNEAALYALFARIRQVFTPALMNEKKELGDPSPVPVFIIGMPRSGTTLIEQLLASHLKVFGAGELENLRKAVAELGGAHNVSCFPEAISSMTDDQLRHFGTGYVDAIRARAPKAERIVDKMPLNFRYAGLINLALPNARIIHVRRDPIDTCLSCFSKLFTGDLAFTYDLGELGRFYRAYESLMQHWRSILQPGVMLEVCYEDLIADFEGQARRIIAHCGLEWDVGCLSFYETQRPVRTASTVEVRQPIYRSSIGRWRRYERLLGHLIDGLGCGPPKSGNVFPTKIQDVSA